MDIFGLIRKRRGEGDNEIASALKAWQKAVKYFENVRDPELIEYAIYDMEAAKRKYMFLLKRKERVCEKRNAKGEVKDGTFGKAGGVCGRNIPAVADMQDILGATEDSRKAGS